MPNWPNEDPDIHEIVRVAFQETYPGVMNLSIYHVLFHDNENKWTVWVSGNEFKQPTCYYQLYHNNGSTVFLSIEEPDDNSGT